VTPLGELTVRWTGSDEEEFDIDEFEGAPAEPASAAPEPDAEPAADEQDQTEGEAQ
jgi:segregation and condensation protein A